MLTSHRRRRLLQLAGTFLLGHAFDIRPGWAKPEPAEVTRRTLASFLDVLLPRDEFSGSATDLHVDEQLWEYSETDPQFRKLIVVGCQWLNLTGGPPFAELTQEQQVVLVEWMAASDWNQVPRRFYELVRQAAVELYYSEPASWAGLPIDRPPQPIGYPPPWS